MKMTRNCLGAGCPSGRKMENVGAPIPQGRLAGMDDGSATPASVHYFCERTSLYVGGASTSTWTFWRSRHTRAWNLHRNSFFRLGVLPARQILNLSGSAPPNRDPETAGRRPHC